MPRLAPTYLPREPHATVLYRLVKEHGAEFLELVSILNAVSSASNQGPRAITGLCFQLSLATLTACASATTPFSDAMDGSAPDSGSTPVPRSDGGAPVDAASGNPAKAPRVVYLNFHGEVWEPGADDATQRRSVLLAFNGEPKTVISGFAAAHGEAPDYASRERIAARVTELVTVGLAPFDVVVSTARPATSTFTEVVIGGAPRDIGETRSPAGVAGELDCDDENPSNTAVVFADSGALLIPTTEDAAAGSLASTALHELGHTFGLAHTDDTSDIMHPNNFGSLTWGKGATVSAGNDGSGTCGRATQDAHALLLARLGPHVPRGPIALAAPALPPTIAVSAPINASAPGLSISVTHTPCIRINDSTSLLGAFSDTWVHPTAYWTRFARAAVVASGTKSFAFNPVSIPPGTDTFERIAVLYGADQLLEVRAVLVPAVNGPTPGTCD